MRVDLFVIDGQNDFCDPNSGALFVQEADKEAQQVPPSYEPNPKRRPYVS